MNKEEAEDMLLEAAQKLGEHFDVIQILASSIDENGTTLITRGVGNWYARQGMAHAFINMDVAGDHATKLAEALKTKDDE